MFALIETYTILNGTLPYLVIFGDFMCILVQMMMHLTIYIKRGSELHKIYTVKFVPWNFCSVYKFKIKFLLNEEGGVQ